jgi:tetratricopeptide (TPR) repeat protein
MNRCIAPLAIALTCVAARPAGAQTLSDLRKLYDAGKFQQVITAAADAKVPDDQQPRITYLVGQSHQKLSHPDEAHRAYEELASRNESDPWRDVGRSALALLSSDAAAAVEAANQAVARGDSLAEAHFQRGLALYARQDMAGSAAAFDKASQLDPTWAYAHYYAGLVYSKAKRVDLTASHFDTFLKLAPQAPERGEVQAIMRTLSARH